MFNFVNNVPQKLNAEKATPNENENQHKDTSKCKATVTVLKTPETIQDPMDKILQPIILNKLESPPPTQIDAICKSPGTPTLTIGLPQIYKTIQEKKIMQQSNVHQAPTIFSGAIFNNCIINLQMPPNYSKMSETCIILT